MRTVTIEPPATTFCIDDNDHLSIHHDNFRPSMDSQACASDLRTHINGGSSPICKSSRSSRYSRQSIESVNTLGMGCKHTAASPFPQAPLSAMRKNSIGKCMEFVETYVNFVFAAKLVVSTLTSVSSILQTHDEATSPRLGIPPGRWA
jgi:hypothetical protein